ncbi:alpha/beta fold hydrolase [Mycobacterium sp. 1274761.0]|uniref:alpha/beta fold hydrolase n=1 Tax=Mycobacterium sp. 1274761.0 TaxID=1834077 RepID=UPI0007FDFB48|nr:alpha/beta hydrolase [Mycobacterium sp. 1274761.0]OBK75022.1 esterase [Mycobacterium sp. 1274761.0]
MTLPSLVLVHGGGFAADCWEPTVDAIQRREPKLKVLAVDLPGRRNKAGDLITACIDEWVDSVVSDIENAALDDLVIVGHSLAGLTVPAVVTKLGSAQVREMILATAQVPANGSAIVDTFPGAQSWYARRAAKRKVQKGRSVRPGGLPTALARFVFCNGMTPAQRRFTLARSCQESPSIMIETVDRSGMPDDVPRMWILTRRDRAVSMKIQHQCIAALGGVQKIIEIDTCHMVMVSEPERLAQILVDRCRRYV